MEKMYSKEQIKKAIEFGFSEGDVNGYLSDNEIDSFINKLSSASPTEKPEHIEIIRALCIKCKKETGLKYNGTPYCWKCFEKEILPSEKPLDMEELTIIRVEVIDSAGRIFTRWNKGERAELSFHDQGRTFKVFIKPII